MELSRDVGVTYEELLQRASQESEAFIRTRDGELLTVLWWPAFLPYHLHVVHYSDRDSSFEEFSTLVSCREDWVANLDQHDNWTRFCGIIIGRLQTKRRQAMDPRTVFPWWQALADEKARNMAHRRGRNTALSLANEANRRHGDISSMSLEEAEALAAEANKFDADLDYLEAATKDGGAAQASTRGPAVEDSPHVLEGVKNIKKKKATRKMKAKAKLAGAAAPTQESVDRKARADNVQFIRSRTNSRSGTNTPLTTSVREAPQMVPEPVEDTPSAVASSEDVVQTAATIDDESAVQKAPTREEKGKWVVRDPPAEESNDTPTMETSTMAEPPLQMEQPSQAPDVQQAHQQVPVSQQTVPDPQAKKKKKKKKGGKRKKMSHPERVKKYVLAARVTERLARYENPQTPRIKLPRRIATLHAASSSMSQALRGSQFHPRGPQSGDSQQLPRPSATSSSATSLPYAPPYVSASAQSGTSLPPAPSNVPASSPPAPTPGAPTDGRPSFNNLRWAYATHTEADLQMLQHNVFLFEKLPIMEAPPLAYPEPYHQLSEAPPIIVSHAETGNEGPSVHFTGDPNWPGDSLMHIMPAATARPDARRHPGHPDFLPDRLLREYQAVEIATGKSVWRHDREHLDCRHPKCKKKVVDFNPDTILCLGCGPKTYTRYCSIAHMMDDLNGHWKECGTDEFIIKRVIDHNTTPRHFWRYCPAIPNRHGYYSMYRYRQRAFAMMTAGQYTLMNYTTTNKPVVITWPTKDPNHAEMSSRVERVLNILLFDHKNEILLNYLFRLIFHMLEAYKADNEEALASIAVQFALEFQCRFDNDYQLSNRKEHYYLRRENYLRPICETDWDGDTHHHVPSSPCVKYFDHYKFGEIAHAANGKGIRSMVEEYEAEYWVLRAWRQRHECPYWRQRAENTCENKFPGVKEGRYHPHPYLGEGFEGWGAPDSDMCEPWVYDVGQFDEPPEGEEGET
ncbi:MAG: hypothetical protein Q9195_007007 [Heterodermia aff. obscurata]